MVCSYLNPAIFPWLHTVMSIGLVTLMIDTLHCCSLYTFLGHSLISWSSKKHVVTRSRALANVAPNISWIQSLLSELHLLPHSCPLWCDNVSTLSPAANLIFHSQSTHVEFILFVTRFLLRSLMFVMSHCLNNLLMGLPRLSLNIDRFCELKSNLV